MLSNGRSVDRPNQKTDAAGLIPDRNSRKLLSYFLRDPAALRIIVGKEDENR
jgi:hypothetical protein